MIKQEISFEGKDGGICTISEHKDDSFHVYVEDKHGHYATINVSGYGFEDLFKKTISELDSIRYKE